MWPPMWGNPLRTTVLLEQLRSELNGNGGRFDSSLKALLQADPVEVGQTPADVVYSENKLRVLHYRAVAARTTAIPLLIVPSLINRYYILDLLPGKSLVEHLIAQGIDVYMLDWGVPTAEDRFVAFDYLITGYLRRVMERVMIHAGYDRVSVLGYCLGGTLSAIYAALYGQHVHGLVALAAPINFHDGSLLSQWAASPLFNVDMIVDTLGNMPAELMQASFNMLKPTAQIRQQMALADRLGNMQGVQDYLAMHTWINDNVPFPGEAFRKYIKECYQQNHLIEGKLVIGNRRVDLQAIDCPVLTITAANDHICSPVSAVALHEAVSSADKQLLRLDGGHVGMVAGHAARTVLWPALTHWLQEHGAAADG